MDFSTWAFRVLLTMFYCFPAMILASTPAVIPQSHDGIARRLGDNVPRSTMMSLRILPLGDSITFGYVSSDGNGYRKHLLDSLVANGTAVKYLGSIQSGNMTDNHNEGHPGYQIVEVGIFATLSLPQKPDVILIMAGTNDMVKSYKLPEAPARLGALIDQCHLACPDAVILVAKLPPSTDWIVQANINAFNPAVPGVVATRVANKVKALVVDMSSYLTTADLFDALHPNDIGYKKMAQGWYTGLQAAIGYGWLDSLISTSSTAAKATTVPATVAKSTTKSTVSTTTSMIPATATKSTISTSSAASKTNATGTAAAKSGASRHNTPFPLVVWMMVIIGMLAACCL